MHYMCLPRHSHFQPFLYSDTYKIKGLFSLAQDHVYFQKHPELFQMLQLLLLGGIGARQLLFISREFKKSSQCLADVLCLAKPLFSPSKFH